MMPSSQMTTSSSSRTSHDFRFSLRFLKRLNTDRRRFDLACPIGAIETVELTDVIDESRSTSWMVDESELY